MPTLPPQARATLPAQASGTRPAMPTLPAQARVPGMKKGGSVDGIARKGRTKGKVIKMAQGGACR